MEEIRDAFPFLLLSIINMISIVDTSIVIVIVIIINTTTPCQRLVKKIFLNWSFNPIVCNPLESAKCIQRQIVDLIRKMNQVARLVRLC